MPTITIDRKSFEKLVGKKLPTDKLKDRISYLGTDLEEVTDEEIIVEIFPNRPDMLSVQGFARAFSSFIGAKTGLRKYEVKDSGEEVIIDKSLTKVRPYTACAIVKNLKFDDEKIKEAILVQEKLHVTYGRNRRKVAIGIYPYEKIKPPIRFLAKKAEDIRFRPLEFQKEINARQVLSQHPTGRDYGHLLEGFDRFPVFIDSDNRVLSVPPIVNSHDTGKINEKTTDVFIECSGFDFDVLHKCLNMVVTALADMGGEIYSMKLRYPDKLRVTPVLEPSEMELDINYVNKRLGLELNKKQAIELLQRMGYGNRGDKVLVPAYRADILHQADLAEDIAIAYGYDNFEAVIPKVATIAEENKFEAFRNKVSDVLAGLGLLEVNTYNLTSIENQAKKMNADVKPIMLANSVSAEYSALRSWIIPSIMEVFASNKHHDYPQKIFGSGVVFKKNSKTDTGVEENMRIAVGLCGDNTDYTGIRQVLDYLMRMLSVEYEIEETEHSSFIPGRVGRVKVKGRKIAYIGEMSPEAITNWSLEMPVSVFELNLTELFEIIKN